MASSPPLPPVVGGQIQLLSTNQTRAYNNENSTLNNYPYEFSVILNITLLTNLDQGVIGATQFDATTITVGQWLLQNTGFAYLIVAIEPPIDANTVTVTIRDVDMYNALSDPSQQGSNYPSEGTGFIIFSLSEEGVPIITNSTLFNLTGSWLNDALGRFAYRNFIETYYNFDINNSTIDYSTYSLGQIVYIGQVGGTGPYCFIPIDNSNPAHVAKSFGLVTSVNQPEMGNIYVRPFGKVITTLPVSLSNANIGDVLYYDSTNANGNYTTNIAPAENPIPIYIKISDNVVSVLYGSIASGGSGGSGGPGDTGATGQTGAEGATGQTGTEGATGQTGQTGQTGAEGATGQTGQTGRQGDTGVTGQTGTEGATGQTGQTGAEGATGQTGTEGATGQTGTEGATGQTGAEGTTGQTGRQGDTGVTGQTGQTGAEGATGQTGRQGDTGVTGQTGQTGQTGRQGDTGVTGQTGATGQTGQTGAEGATGYTGAEGATGQTGRQGDTGTNGIGVPVGGTANQVLSKIDSSDYNTQWVSLSNGSSLYNDAWIQSNFIDSPPLVTFQTISATTTQIFVPWIYPTQFPIGLVNSWIPVINTLSANFEITLSSLSQYRVSTLTNVSTNFVNYNNGTSFVTGIVLSRLAGINGIQSLTFPNTSTTRNAYVYYDTNMASMISTVSTNIMNIWYSNNNPSTNIASVFLSTFLNAGPPSVPLNLSSSSLTPSSLRFNYTTPARTDTTDTSSLLTIQLYTITFVSQGSLIRYPSGIVDNIRTISNSSNLSYTATSLYPDSPYTFSVNAENSANISGPYASTVITTSNITSLSALTGTLSFTSRYYPASIAGSVKNISTGSTITTLVSSTSNWTSASFIIPINNTSSRGLLGGSNSTLMYLSTTLLNGTSIGGPRISFTGFPATTPVSSLVNNITVTPSVTDTYSTSGTAYQGFYLQSQNTITIGSNAFIASPLPYTLSAIQSGTFSGTANFSYNYDIPPGVPLISSISFNFNGISYSTVSGVNIIYGTPGFSVITDASNLGNFFYNSPLISYSNCISGSWSPSSETTLSNITSGKTVSSFTSLVSFSNVLTANLTTTYASTITLSASASNIAAGSSVLSATPIPAIVDGKSYTLVYTTLPNTIPSITNNNTQVIGYRVLSLVAGPTNVPPFLNNSTVVAASAYDNSVNITTTEELQVSNGTFTTPSGQLFSYKNYNNIFYYTSVLRNSVDYSSIPATGYRYATFVWKIAGISPSKYNTLTFTMNTTATITITNNLAYAGVNPIQLYYRFENQSTPTPTDLSNPLTSAWINGNSQSGIQTGSGNYFTPSDYTQPQTAGLIASATMSGEFSVYIPVLIIPSDTTEYLYCRIGLPMSSQFSFSYITAKMT